MDKIRILNLKIPAKHGAFDFEKVKEGLFELDIEMQADLTLAKASDRLDDTINYADAVSYISEVFKNKDYNLIETVGEKICVGLIEEYPLKTVTVRIRKPHAPIMAILDTVEIEITRHK